jgi:hypothetical protein
MHYPKKCLTPGEPMQHLKGDMRFIAARMKVSCPPLPPQGKKEHALINKHFLANPKQTTASLTVLAEKFLEQADGINIFPKLVTQLKAGHKKWEQNNLVRIAVREMGRGGYTQLLRNLASWRMAAGDLASFEDSQVHALATNPLL